MDSRWLGSRDRYRASISFGMTLILESELELPYEPSGNEGISLGECISGSGEMGVVALDSSAGSGV
jgi:hypothetical protein